MDKPAWLYDKSISVMWKPESPPGLYGDVEAWLKAYEQGTHAIGWEKLHAASMARLATYEG